MAKNICQLMINKKMCGLPAVKEVKEDRLKFLVCSKCSKKLGI